MCQLDDDDQKLMQTEQFDLQNKNKRLLTSDAIVDSTKKKKNINKIDLIRKSWNFRDGKQCLRKILECDKRTKKRCRMYC